MRTGDLGERRPDGLLRITGHKEDLFKTGKGKYVAPAPIESRLNAHSMIEVALVSGAGQHAPYGVFVLEEQLRGRLSDAGVRAEVNAELAELLHEVNEGIADYEWLRILVVAREPCSIENC